MRVSSRGGGSCFVFGFRTWLVLGVALFLPLDSQVSGQYRSRHLQQQRQRGYSDSAASSTSAASPGERQRNIFLQGLKTALCKDKRKRPTERRMKTIRGFLSMGQIAPRKTFFFAFTCKRRLLSKLHSGNHRPH